VFIDLVSIDNYPHRTAACCTDPLLEYRNKSKNWQYRSISSPICWEWWRPFDVQVAERTDLKCKNQMKYM